MPNDNIPTRDMNAAIGLILTGCAHCVGEVTPVPGGIECSCGHGPLRPAPVPPCPLVALAQSISQKRTDPATVTRERVDALRPRWNAALSVWQKTDGTPWLPDPSTEPAPAPPADLGTMRVEPVIVTATPSGAPAPQPIPAQQEPLVAQAAPVAPPEPVAAPPASAEPPAAPLADA